MAVGRFGRPKDLDARDSLLEAHDEVFAASHVVGEYASIVDTCGRQARLCEREPRITPVEAGL